MSIKVTIVPVTAYQQNCSIIKCLATGRGAVVGDVLFQGSIGRTDFPRGDHAQLLNRIRERLFPLGDDITFVPGHGPTSTFGQERRTNPFVADARYG